MNRLRTRLRSGASSGFAPASLSLDFLGTSNTLDNRITFSRGSQATLTDSTGKLTYAPNNLLTNSEGFETASWGKFAANISSNVTAAPDGTTTADKAIATAVAGYHGVSFNIAPGPLTHIFSIYVKASEYSRFRISDGASSRFAASFTLTGDGVVSDTSGANFVAAGITPVGNGWYRCFVRVTNISGSAAFQFMGYPAGATLDGYGVQYTGDGTSGIFIWGAQLEQVTYQTTPGTYNSTTPKNLLGYTQEFDNAAWTKSNSFVQTNLLLYSEQLDNGVWGKTAGGTGVAPVVTANQGVAPDGVTSADLVVFDAGANGASDFSRLQGSSFTATAQPYTFSVWLKTSDNSTKTATISISGAGASTVTITGTWQRFSTVWTASAGTFSPRIVVGNALTDATASLLIWGAQLVQGSTAGDYQRTDAAAAAVQYTAPDGTLSADKLVENTATAQHYALQGSTTLAIPYTFSVYVKAAERTFAMIYNTQTTTGQVVNLSTGALAGNAGLNAPTSSSVTDVGNGWHLVSMTFTATAASNTFRIYAMSDATTYSYTGDGTSGIYIWGAQLSNSASVDPYVYNPAAALTSTAYYGPRFDYDPIRLTPKGLLIEEARTNLLTYSEQFDDASWTKIGTTVSANAATSPDGTADADSLVEDSATSDHRVNQPSISAGSGANTFSVYLKAGSRTFARIQFDGTISAVASSAGVDVNLSTGATGSTAVVGNISAASVAVTNVGNGWYRVALTATLSASGTLAARVFIMQSIGGSTSYTGNGSGNILLYGAQLEAGSFATSYIPTVASTVTRSADVALMQGANFSNWYNQNAGTLTAEATLDIGIPSANGRVVTIGPGAQRVVDIHSTTAWVSFNGTNTISSGVTAVTSNSPVKFAAAYAPSNYALSVNGSAAATDTAATLYVPTQMNIGSYPTASNYLNGHIRRINYYPQRLPDYQLQRLTA